MGKVSLSEVATYVEENIGTFHEKRIQGLSKLSLSKVLKRKNPYLFKAKHLLTAEQIVRQLVGAHISSNEETLFGDWLEGLAIFINERVYGGWKSGIRGIDLEFDKEGVRYIVTIKSGPNWGNSGQIKKMQDDFRTARRTLRTSNSGLQVEAVNGCCYGRDDRPDKGDYFKYCGQRFWAFLSGDSNLYIDLVEPLGHTARAQDAHFQASYARMINLFTREFSDDYCGTDGAIDWERLVRFNAAAR